MKNRRQRRAQPERDVPQGGHGRGGARRRGSCASRCTSSCCARPTRARPRSCCARPTAAASGDARSRSRRRCCARTCPGSVLGEATPLAGIDDADITPPTTLAAPRRVRGGRASARTTSTSSSARTPTRRASCSPTRSSGCARRASRRSSSTTAPRRIGGRLPVNPSGGLLSKGEPLGASALGQVVELVAQLRGTAGPRQVEGARVGLAHTVGRGANASVVIVKR